MLLDPSPLAASAAVPRTPAAPCCGRGLALMWGLSLGLLLGWQALANAQVQAAGVQAVQATEANMVPDEPTPPGQPERPRIQREVFVPLADLLTVLETQKRGVLLSREDYEKLLKEAAAKSPGERPPVGHLITRGAAAAKIEGTVLVISLKLELEQLTPGWTEWRLPALDRLSIDSARLDGQAALLYRAAFEIQPNPGRQGGGMPPRPPLQLLTQGVGTHQLELELTTPLVAAGSDQVAAFVLPTVPAGEMTLTLPAQKQLVSNGITLERAKPLAEANEYRLPFGGQGKFQLRLTERAETKATDALLFASTAYGLVNSPGEVTWQTMTSLQVFGRAIDRLELSVPAPLEVAAIEATGLEAWTLSDDAANKGRTKMTLVFAQPFEGQRMVTIRGVMPIQGNEPWAVPPLKIEGATSHVGKLIVRHPGEVRLRTIEETGVRRSDGVASLDKPQPTPIAAPPVDPSTVTALEFEVWREEFDLRFITEPKARELSSAVAMVLEVAARGIELTSSVIIETRYVPLFDLEFDLPAEWSLLSAESAEGQPLTWQVVPGDAGVNRIRIALDKPLPPGERRSIRFTARQLVDNWPVEENEPVSLVLPTLPVVEATLTETALVVRADDDLEVTAGELTAVDLVPLKADDERLRLQSQVNNWKGTLTISRRPSRWTTKGLTGWRLDQQSITTFVSVHVDIRGGGVRNLMLSLPENTGTDLRFDMTGAGGRIVEQQAGPVVRGRRLWVIRFRERARGTVALWATIEQSRPEGESFEVPELRVVDSQLHGGFIALEAGADQKLTIDAKAADGTPLKEADLLDVPPSPWSPKERLVALYETLAEGAKVVVTEQRFDRVGLPSAICRSLAMESHLPLDGAAQHQATFRLQAANVQNLSVQLPPDSRLWAVMVDGKAVEARLAQAGFLVPLSGRSGPSGHSGQGGNDSSQPSAGAERVVVIYYETSGTALATKTLAALGRDGGFQGRTPALQVVTSASTLDPVEILEQTWKVHYPENLLLVKQAGLLEATTPLDQPGELAKLKELLSEPRWSRLLPLLFVAGIAILLTVLACFVRLKTGVWGCAGAAGLLAVGLLLLVCVTPWFIGGMAQRPTSMMAGTSRSETEFYKSDEMDFSKKEAKPRSLRRLSPSEVTPEFLERAEKRLKDANQYESQPTPAATAAPATPMPAPMEEKAMDQLQAGDKSNRYRFGVDNDLDGARDGTKLNLDAPVAGQPLSTADKPGRPIIAGEGAETLAGRADQRWDGPTGKARLSLALDWQAPAGMRAKEFRYIGTGSGIGSDINQAEDVSLQLGYVDQRQTWLWVRWMFCMGALLAWFFRSLPTRTKVLIVGVGLPVALGLTGVAPAGWQLWLDGLFLALSAAGIVWLGVLLFSLCDCCVSSLTCGWPNRWRGPFTRASLLFIAASMSLASLSGVLQAQELEAQATKAIAPAPPTPIGPPVDRIIFPVPTEGASGEMSGDKILGNSDQVLIPAEKYLELYLKANPDKRPVPPAPHAGGLAETLLLVDLVAKPQAPVDPDQPAAKAEEAAKAAKSQWTHDVRLKARLLYVSHTDQPLLLAVPFRQMTWNRAELDGAVAPLVQQEGQTKILIASKGPHVLDLEAIIDRSSSLAAGQFQLAFEPLIGGKLTWNVPREGLAIRLNGATTGFRQSPPRDNQPRTVEVSLGALTEVSLAWQPEGDLNVANRTVSLNSLTALSFDDSGLKISTGLEYLIRQGSIVELELSVPPSLRIQSVSGPDVGSWELSGEDPARKLKVFLRRNVGDSTRLTIDAYRELAVSDEPTRLSAPQLVPLGVTHETGTLGVFAARQLNVRVERTGLLTQIDTTRFTGSVPVSRPGTPPQFAYRFSARPYVLDLRVQRQVSKVTADVEHGVLLLPNRQQQTTRLVAQISGVPRATMTFRLPTGWQQLRVESPYLKDWYETRPEGQHLLTVEWRTPREGTVEIVLAGTVASVRNGGTATRSTLPLDVPEVLDVDRLSSQLGVWTDTAVMATFVDPRTWRSIDAATLKSSLASLKQGHAPQLAFSSENPANQPISLSITRLEPQITGESLSIVSVTDGAIAQSMLLNWQISRAATDLVAVSASPEFAGKIEFQGPEIRSVATSKGRDGRPLWTISLRTPAMGSLSLSAIATTEFTNAVVTSPGLRFEETGTPPGVPAPAEEAANKANSTAIPQTHFVLLLNPSRSVLTRADPEQADAVTREDLRVRVSEEFLQRAAEFLRVKTPGTSLKWNAQALAQARLAAASVNLADLVTVVARDGTYRTSATYLLKNRSRQFLALVFPQDARLLSVMVEGSPSRAVETLREGKSYRLVALPRTSAADLSLTVKVVIAGRLGSRLPTLGGWAAKQVDIPAPQVVSPETDETLGIPVARTRWAVSLPEDLHATGLADTNRNNLNTATEVQSELSLQQARLQELSYLISVADNSTNFELQSQSLANGLMLNSYLAPGQDFRQRAGGKDLAAVDEYEVTRNTAQRQLDELQQKLVAKGAKLTQQNNALPTNERGSGLVILDQQSEGLLEARSNAEQIIVDNRSTTLSNGRQEAETFWFDLQTPEMDQKRELAKSKKSGEQSVAQDFDARRQYQAFNNEQLDALNGIARARKGEAQSGKEQMDSFKSLADSESNSFGFSIAGQAGNRGMNRFGNTAVGQPAKPSAAESLARQQDALGDRSASFASGPNGIADPMSRKPSDGPPANAPQSPAFTGNMGGPMGGGFGGGLGGLGGGEGSGSGANGIVQLEDSIALGLQQKQNMLGELPALQTQGLSVAAQLPTGGRTFLFSKPGGDARLALDIVPAGRSGSITGWSWLAAFLAIAVGVALMARRGRHRLTNLVVLALLIPALGAAILLTPTPIAWLLGLAFVAAIISLAALTFEYRNQIA